MFAHPASMGSITKFTFGGLEYDTVPVGGDTSNTLGNYSYNGVNYRLYRFFDPAPAGTTYNGVQITTCV